MSEVKRYGHIGYLVNASERLLELYPDMTVYVKAANFDRVTAELASANSDKEAYAQNAIDLRKRVDTLQARLTAADQRADRLECEVGRLKKISDNYCSLLMDANSRLSVADLAVGAIKSWTEETRESVLESFQAELNDSASYEWYDNAISDLMKLVCALKPAEGGGDE